MVIASGGCALAGSFKPAMLASADSLLNEAASIVARTPVTNMQASILTGGDGRVFYAHDRALQIEVDKHHGGDSFVIDVSSAEEFSYHAVADTLASCNGPAARENLRVARAFLAEAHRDLAGTAKDDWEPPDINPDESDRCQ
jgi:hypothetical protein